MNTTEQRLRSILSDPHEIDAALAQGLTPEVLVILPLRRPDENQGSEQAQFLRERALTDVDILHAKQARLAWWRREICQLIQAAPALLGADFVYAALAHPHPAQPAPLMPVLERNEKDSTQYPAWGRTPAATAFFAQLGDLLAEQATQYSKTFQPLPPYKDDMPENVLAWGHAWALAVAFDALEWLTAQGKTPEQLLLGSWPRLTARRKNSPLPSDSKFGPMRLQVTLAERFSRVLVPLNEAAYMQADGRRSSIHTPKRLTGGDKDRNGLIHYTGLQGSDLYLSIWLEIAEQIATSQEKNRMNHDKAEAWSKAHSRLPPSLQALVPPGLAELVHNLLPQASGPTYFASPSAGQHLTDLCRAIAPQNIHLSDSQDGTLAILRFTLVIPELATPEVGWLSTLLLLRIGPDSYSLECEVEEIDDQGQQQFTIYWDKALSPSPTQWQNSLSSLKVATRPQGRGLSWVGMIVASPSKNRTGSTV